MKQSMGLLHTGDLPCFNIYPVSAQASSKYISKEWLSSHLSLKVYLLVNLFSANFWGGNPKHLGV